MIDACDGTLIVHALYPAECTDESCVELSEVRHALIIDCGELDDCACQDESNQEGSSRQELPHAS
ncbi:hypothetical protein [Rhodococcus sp. NPDC049939]|uniref:hypothetical protein n=1 Tax=Rhodococcus sp. NPDC049939 TaxID=3155511 RepID=UPI00340BB89B